MRRILDEWQIQVRVEMMRNGWEVKDLADELEKKGCEVKTEILKKALNHDGYVGAGIKICDALGITERLAEEDRPSYIYNIGGQHA